jgi:hypothetical protein
MKMKTKINLNLINIISIFIVIIIIGYVLIPWSKGNTEHFDVIVNITDDIKKGANYITLFDYILESRKFSIDFENRIKELKKTLESGGVLKDEDFKEIIEEVNNKISENTEYKSNNKIGRYILSQNDKDRTITDLKKQIDDLKNTIQTEMDIVSTSQPTLSGGIKKKTIKSSKYGISLSVQELTNNNNKIIIHLNNGCLTYDKNNSKELYSVKNCEITNTKQHFFIRENVNNFVISPVDNLNLFLKIDNNGISLEKFNTTFVSGKLNLSEEFIWFVLPFEINTCQKLEQKKITFK